MDATELAVWACPVDDILQSPAASAPGKARILGAVLILAVIIAYIPAINAGFIWDDDLLLTKNTQLETGAGLKEVWLGKNCCDYIPLTFTTFWLEKQLWGETSTGYHVTNILLHAGAAVLLWRILAALRIPGAWLAALLFAIHPVNVASVAWIAERKNTLSAACFFAAIYFFLIARERSDIRRLVLSIVFFLLAGLSKGSVATLPLVLVGCILWTDRRIARRDVVWLLPFFLVALAVSCLTIKYQSQATDYHLAGFSLVDRAIRAGVVPWLHLRDLLFPIGLSPMSPVWQPNLRSPFVYLSPIVILAIILLFLCKSRTWGRPLLFGASYYLWMLLPVLGLIWMAFQQETSCANWWQYLAAPGVFALLAGGIVTFVSHASTRRRRLCWHAAVCIAMALLLVQTWRRCAIYKSMESYCVAGLAENPRAWGLENNLGIVLGQRGKTDRAAACYRRALSQNPRFMQAHANLGNLLSKQSKWAEAEQEFKAALQLQPTNGEVLANLSNAYFMQGRMHDALATNAEAIKADPANPQHYSMFGIKLNAAGQFDRAAVCFRNALILSPGDPRIEIDLIRTLIAAGRPGDAAAVCQEAVSVAARSGNEHLVRAFGLLRKEAVPSSTAGP